jgi:hypothetical protein
MAQAGGQWKIDSSRIDAWRASRSADHRDRVDASLRALARGGPDLRGGLVKRIKSSCHREMMELRPPGTNLRVLFAFDKRDTAVMLVGGDKTNQWRTWYERNVGRADRTYDRHLRSTGQEPTCRTGTPRAEARGR